jgi:tetratricopeptide (TPR) repeat protein
MEAQLLCEKEEYAEAEAKIDECLKIYRATIPASYINYATAVMIQGMIYGQTGRLAEAEKLLREAVQLRAQYSPNGHFLRAVAENELGQFLAGQKRFDEAQALMLPSYESLKNSQAPDSPRVRTALERLVSLYENWGRSGEASKYKALLGQ